jgi:hypothetical protein
MVKIVVGMLNECFSAFSLLFQAYQLLLMQISSAEPVATPLQPPLR